MIASMDAQPELALIARVLAEHKLEAIRIGNLAAALHVRQDVLRCCRPRYSGDDSS